jgi:hypothetical protein
LQACKISSRGDLIFPAKRLQLYSNFNKLMADSLIYNMHEPQRSIGGLYAGVIPLQIGADTVSSDFRTDVA